MKPGGVRGLILYVLIPCFPCFYFQTLLNEVVRMDLGHNKIKEITHLQVCTGFFPSLPCREILCGIMTCIVSIECVLDHVTK